MKSSNTKRTKLEKLFKDWDKSKKEYAAKVDIIRNLLAASIITKGEAKKYMEEL